jgi:hypothetical protein
MDTISKNTLRSRLVGSRLNIVIAICAALAIVVIGFLIVRSNAAGFFAFSELEKATVTGKAIVVTDPTAAGGKSVQFTAGVSPRPVPGLGCLTKPSSCGYPDATNTGVPAGAVLTTVPQLILKTPGEVVTNMDVTGSIKVTAPGVVIRNTKVHNTGADRNNNGAIYIAAGGSAIIEDTDINGGNATIAVGPGNFTLRRVDVTGSSDGVRADGVATIVDSYIHDLVRVGESHNDTVQSLTSSNVVIKHNTLFPFTGTIGLGLSGGDPMNAAYMLGNTSGDLMNILVEDNIVNGGNYTFSVNWLNTDAGLNKAGNIRIINNWFGRDYRFGPQQAMTHGITFTGNAYIDSGALVN